MKRNLFYAGLTKRSFFALAVVLSFMQIGCGASDPAPLKGEIAKTNIAFTESENNALWIIRADATGLRKLNSDARSTVRFSPDGKLLTFKMSDHIHAVTDLDGNILYTFQGCLDSDDFTWSPDGKAIVFGCYFSGIWRYNLGDAAPVELVSSIDRTYDHGPVISPDGSRIIYTHNEYGVQYTIYTIDPDGGNQKLIERGVSAQDARNCMVWADNAHVIFTPLDGTIHYLDVDTLVDTVSYAGFTSGAISLNNNKTMMSLYGNLFLYLSSATGLPSGTVDFGTSPVTWDFIGSNAFAWSPDGAYFVVSGDKLAAYEQDDQVPLRILDLSLTEYRLVRLGNFPELGLLLDYQMLGADWAAAPI